MITLGITGVVAALTMPALIANYKEKEIITKAKKDYSLVMQALQLAQAEYGTPGDNSSLFLSSASSDGIVQEFAKYIKGGYLCLSSSNDNICNDLSYKVLYSIYKNKYFDLSLPAIILPDNGIVYLTLSDNKCVDTLSSGANLDSEGNPIINPDGTTSTWTDIRNACGMVYFDVNGPAKPNKAGYDVFCIQVSANKTGVPYWDICGYSSLKSILTGGKLIFNTSSGS